MNVYCICIVHLYQTRLLGRFAPIFYLNCEHVIFVYISKQRRKKFCGFLKKNSAQKPLKLVWRSVQPYITLRENK